MSEDSDDNDVEAFLERLDEKDEQINALEADLEETEADLSEKEARVEELEDQTDDRIAELEDEVEELRKQNEAAREQYAAALAAADTVFDEDELAENYTLAELSAKIEKADFSTDVSETEPFVRSGSGEGVEANLSAAEQEEKAELESRLSELDDKEGLLAEKERDRLEAELAELTGGDA
jgi:DNA repair exonuclease SbcCD ATPase subunit